MSICDGGSSCSSGSRVAVVGVNVSRRHGQGYSYTLLVS